MEDSPKPTSPTGEDPSASASPEEEDPSLVPASSSGNKSSETHQPPPFEKGKDVEVVEVDSSVPSSLPPGESSKDEHKDPPISASSSSEQREEEEEDSQKNENVEEEAEEEEAEDDTPMPSSSSEEDEEGSLPLVHCLNPTQIRKLDRSQRKSKEPSHPTSPDQSAAVPSSSRPQETEEEGKSLTNKATSETEAQEMTSTAREEDKSSNQAEGSEESQPKPRYLHIYGNDPDATDSGSTSEDGSSQVPTSRGQGKKYEVYVELPPVKKAKKDDQENRGDK